VVSISTPLKDKVLSYQDLENLPIVCLEENTSTRKYIEDFLKEKQVTIQPEFALATSDMLIQFAMRNLGIACVVEDFALEKIKSGELFRLKFEEEIPAREFCIIYDEKVPSTKAAKALLDKMLQEK